MCRSTKALARRGRQGWDGRTQRLLGTRTVRSPPPLSARRRCRLQSCLFRAVLAPERFRGGFAPSAPTARCPRRRLSRTCQQRAQPTRTRRAPGTTAALDVPDVVRGSSRRPGGRAGRRAVSRRCAALRRAASSSAAWLSASSVGPLAGQLGERSLDLAPDAADRDAEDALAALQQVDDLVVAGALVDAGAVAHQRDPGQVVGAALAQVLHRGADLLQRDAGVQEPLDHLEQQDVAEGVEPLGAGAGGAAHGGLDEAGAGPVVELAVGDAGRVAGRRPAVAGVARHRGDVVVEEQTLLVRDLGRLVRRGLVRAAPSRRRCLSPLTSSRQLRSACRSLGGSRPSSVRSAAGGRSREQRWSYSEDTPPR